MESALGEPVIDPRELRKALGAFVTGVTVVTTHDEDGVPRGFTANSFTSVSLDPPLVLVCLANTAGSYQAFATASGYAINILAETQREVSNTFATRSADRFSCVEWRKGPAGNPIFEGTVAWLDCEMHETIEAGDHMVLIGRVVGFNATPHPPLGYCRGAYMTFGLEQEAVGAAGQSTCVGAIIERDRDVLLIGEGDEGPLALPTGVRIGDGADPESLLGGLASMGIDAELSFLFAVFEDDQSQTLNVYYRGLTTVAPKPGANARLYSFDDMPWHRIADNAVRLMLRRYVDERLTTRFSIYVGDSEAGKVRVLDGADGEG